MSEAEREGDNRQSTEVYTPVYTPSDTYHGQELETTEIQALNDLEALVGEPIPVAPGDEWDHWGYLYQGRNVVSVNLYNKGLTSIPESISNFTQMENFRIYKNKVSKLPKSFFTLRNLKKLVISSNEFTEIDPDISKLRSLEAIIFYDLPIAAIPDSITKLDKVNEFNIRACNDLTLSKKVKNWMKKITTVTNVNE